MKGRNDETTRYSIYSRKKQGNKRSSHSALSPPATSPPRKQEVRWLQPNGREWAGFDLPPPRPPACSRSASWCSITEIASYSSEGPEVCYSQLLEGGLARYGVEVPLAKGGRDPYLHPEVTCHDVRGWGNPRSHEPAFQPEADASV